MNFYVFRVSKKQSSDLYSKEVNIEFYLIETFENYVNANQEKAKQLMNGVSSSGLHMVSGFRQALSNLTEINDTILYKQGKYGKLVATEDNLIYLNESMRLNSSLKETVGGYVSQILEKPGNDGSEVFYLRTESGRLVQATVIKGSISLKEINLN
jgi:hypothetical protein